MTLVAVRAYNEAVIKLATTSHFVRHIRGLTDVNMPAEGVKKQICAFIKTIYS